MLALRGWGPEHFRADPQLLAAARWALYAEHAVTLLREADELAATVVDPKMGRDAIDALRVKNAGTAQAKRLRAVLFPGDDDG